MARWRIWRFVGIGLGAYLIALVALLPARFIVRAGPRWAVAGTLWHGQAVLADRYRVEWRWAPLRSLLAAGFAADVELTGDGTDVVAAAVARPHRLVLSGIAGRADAALLPLAVSLPFACDGTMQLDLPRLVLARGATELVGEVRLDDGRCGAAGGLGRQPMPPLLARAGVAPDGSTAIALAPIGQGRRHWLEARIVHGRIGVRITPEGARALPFARGWRIGAAP